MTVDWLNTAAFSLAGLIEGAIGGAIVVGFLSMLGGEAAGIISTGGGSALADKLKHWWKGRGKQPQRGSLRSPLA